MALTLPSELSVYIQSKAELNTGYDLAYHILLTRKLAIVSNNNILYCSVKKYAEEVYTEIPQLCVRYSDTHSPY